MRLAGAVPEIALGEWLSQPRGGEQPVADWLSEIELRTGRLTIAGCPVRTSVAM